MLFKMLDKQPLLANRVDGMKNTPLHMLCLDNTYWHIIDQMIEKYHMEINVRNDQFQSPQDLLRGHVEEGFTVILPKRLQ